MCCRWRAKFIVDAAMARSAQMLGFLEEGHKEAVHAVFGQAPDETRALGVCETLRRTVSSNEADRLNNTHNS